jgi:hypothetical protein
MNRVLVIVTVAAALLAGCSGDSKPVPGATESAATTAASPTPTPLPTPTEAPVGSRPIGDPSQLPPPPYNRFIRPDTGRFEVYEWDDRALTATQKAAQPWYDPRWKPFSDCMIAEGYDVRADATKAFAQQDLDQVVTRANAQLPDANANKRIGGNTSGVPGIAGAFLRCAGRWLALAPEQYGLERPEPGQVPPP